MSRFQMAAGAILAGLAAAGCVQPTTAQSTAQSTQPVAPIATGELVNVTLWEKPVGTPGETGSNRGGSPPDGSRVEVYPRFIIVTSPDGSSELSLHGWYSNLRFNRTEG
jgi:hypothetical protein